MTAFYNEPDPYAAQWLRNLIAAGHIAPGDVDERSVTEVRADDLKSYTQCHFFAGIAVWSHALRRAGWPDDRPVWTGSCPCQPFSQAGKQKGFDDARHLWPVWFRLIEECHPAIVFGEQVASALDWLDLVQTDLEAAHYAFGTSDLCAAGFGGAHIRQRLYYVGLAKPAPEQRNGTRSAGPRGWVECTDGGTLGGLADTSGERRQQDPGSSSADEAADGRARRLRCEPNSDNLAASHSTGGRLAKPDSGQRGRLADGEGRLIDGAQVRRQQGDGELAAGSELLGLAHHHHHHKGPQGWPGVPERRNERAAGPGSLETEPRSAHAPLLGRDAVDWLFCRDGKWRPVGPGTLPLAHASSSRVGRLRAYGNALDAETATQFVSAVMEAMVLFGAVEDLL